MACIEICFVCGLIGGIGSLDDGGVQLSMRAGCLALFGFERSDEDLLKLILPWN